MVRDGPEENSLPHKKSLDGPGARHPSRRPTKIICNRGTGRPGPREEDGLHPSLFNFCFPIQARFAMRTVAIRTVLTTLLFAFLFISTAGAQPGPPDHARPIEGVILIKFAPEALETPPQELRPSELDLQGREAARLRQLLRNNRGPQQGSGEKIFKNFAPADTLGRHRQTGNRVPLKDLSRWYRFPVRDTTEIEDLAKRLQELPLVLKATPDHRATPDHIAALAGKTSPDGGPSENGPTPPRNKPNDSYFPEEQWGLDNIIQGNDVNAPEAWSLNTGRSDVTVAVVDGGVDLDHPDLASNNRILQGFDFGDDDTDPDDDRPNGTWTDHGTPVAGTIGARTNNGEGVAGMMWDLQIMPLKLVESDDDDNPPRSRVAEAFEYARSNGADIINYSGGYYGPLGGDHAVKEAIENARAAGLIIVASAGNDDNWGLKEPARLEPVLGVGATDRDDQRCDEETGRCSFGSNFGRDLDVVAPNRFNVTSRGVEGDLYDFFNGTSHAAPMVSGHAGLVLSEVRDDNLDLSNDDIVHIMEQTAENVEPMEGDFDPEYGHGRIDAYESLRLINENDIVHGNVSFTKIADDAQYQMESSGPWPYGTGQYIVDVWKMETSASFSFDEKPLWWLPVPEKGITAASPNDGSRWIDKSVSKASASAKTFFFFVESSVDGRQIGWYPFDPTVYKHNGSFRWTAIGDSAPLPVEVTISGPTQLESGEEGTWTANVDGGSGSLSYQWYEKYDADTSFNKIYGATSASYSTALYGNVTFKVEVTADNSSDSSTHSVSVDCNRICVKSFEESLTTTSGLSLRGDASGDRAVTLTWQASSAKVQSSGAFAVQHRADSTGAWSQIGTVSVSDSSSADSPRAVAYRFETDELEIGTHQFRVGLPQDAGSGPRAVGSSGTEDTRRYTGPATAQIAMDEAYRLSTYPNPVQQQATVELAVKERQEVSVRLYDVLGRRVATLHNGPLPAQELRRLRLDVSSEGLTSGTYFLRVSGEDVAATEQITVVR